MLGGASLVKALLPVTFLLASISSVAAHPGVGIFMDGKGNVYYTDLRQVWKISPDGARSVAVPNVHTHELYVDPGGNLYGEHLWYEGEATDKWGHRVWRLGADGTLVDVIPARRGFRDDYEDFHFVHDAKGNAYWVDRGDPAIIRRRSPEGIMTQVARASFQDIRWMTAAADGTVYLVDLYDLVRVTPDGAARTVARDLADRIWSKLFFRDRHALMGLWTDAQGSVYVANFSGRVVKRVGPDGAVEVVAESPLPWSPTGGLVAPDGALWILEYSGGAARVRRIGKDGRDAVFE